MHAATVWRRKPLLHIVFIRNSRFCRVRGRTGRQLVPGKFNKTGPLGTEPSRAVGKQVGWPKLALMSKNKKNSDHCLFLHTSPISQPCHHRTTN